MIVSADVKKREVDVLFSTEGTQVSRHSDIFAAAIWLDGYIKGQRRAEISDRSVC